MIDRAPLPADYRRVFATPEDAAAHADRARRFAATVQRVHDRGKASSRSRDVYPDTRSPRSDA